MSDASGAGQASRAEPPAPRRLSALVGGGFALALAAFTVVTVLRERPARVPRELGGVTLDSSREELVQAGYRDAAQGAPRLVASSEVFGEAATCSAALSEQGVTTEIRCSIHSPSAAAARASEKKVLAVLRRLYGDESPGPESGLWRGSQAQLSVTRSDEGVRVELSRRLPP